MTLQLYILRRSMLAIATTFAGTLLVLVPPLALSAFTRLGGVEVGTFLGYLPYLLVELFPYLLPFAFLVGITMTFDRFVADGEWIAMEMAGIHPLRTLAMPLLLALCLWGTTAWLSGSVFPDLRFGQRTYQSRAALQVVRGLFPGRTSIQLGGFAILGRSRSGDTFRDVVLGVPGSHDEPAQWVAADRALIGIREDVLELDLANVHALSGAEELECEALHISIPLDRIASAVLPSRDRDKYQRSSELTERARRTEAGSKEQRHLLLEVHRRDALAAVFFVFLLIGSSTGAHLGRGNLLFVLFSSACYSCAYYVLSIRFGQELARGDVLPVWLAAWGTNGLGAAFGVVAVRRVLMR